MAKKIGQKLDDYEKKVWQEIREEFLKFVRKIKDLKRAIEKA